MFGFELENHSVELVLKLKYSPLKHYGVNIQTPFTKPFTIGNYVQHNDARWCRSLNSRRPDLYNHEIFRVTLDRFPDFFVSGKIDHGTLDTGPGAMIIELASSPVSDQHFSDLITHIFSIVTQSIEVLIQKSGPFAPVLGMYGRIDNEISASLKELPDVFQSVSNASSSHLYDETKSFF